MVYPKLEENRHQIVIEAADKDRLFEQIVLWGEASWWPDNCLMKFVRLGKGQIGKGTMYKQKVLLPFAPSWLSLVTDIQPPESITRRYLDSFLEAEEQVSACEYQGKLKLNYCLKYKIKGILNAIFWRLCFRSLHNHNIKLVLKSLKDYLEK